MPAFETFPIFFDMGCHVKKIEELSSAFILDISCGKNFQKHSNFDVQVGGWHRSEWADHPRINSVTLHSIEMGGHSAHESDSQCSTSSLSCNEILRNEHVYNVL